MVNKTKGQRLGWRPFEDKIWPYCLEKIEDKYKTPEELVLYFFLFKSNKMLLKRKKYKQRTKQDNVK